MEGRMEGVLAMHRMLVSLKELFKNNEVDLTYNEFIIILAIEDKRRYVGSINEATLMDKGLIVRTLTALIEKGIVSRESERGNSRYELTEAGRRCMEILYRDRGDFVESLFTDEEDKNQAVNTRDYIVEYEKRLRQFTFG